MTLNTEIKNLLHHSIQKVMSTPRVIDGEELYIDIKRCPKDVEWADDETDGEEVCMNFTYGDGVAVSEDKRFIMVYPTRASLLPDDREYMQAYQGIDAPRSYTCRDIALCFGSDVFHNPLYKKK